MKHSIPPPPPPPRKVRVSCFEGNGKCRNSNCQQSDSEVWISLGVLFFGVISSHSNNELNSIDRGENSGKEEKKGEKGERGRRKD